MFQILNSKGQPVLLNAREQAIADYNQGKMKELKNALGFEINITTLTQVVKRVTEQKFFKIAPADFMPVKVGDGAWSSELVTYRDFSTAGDFETGIINTGGSNELLAEAGTALDAVHVQTRNWAKQVTWALPELFQAQRSGNWDLVAAKERSRKTNWDLGIQAISFLGSKTDGAVLGLLTQPDVTSNTTLITKLINTMSPTEFATFVAGVVQAYRVNCNFTAWPSHFAIPENDYNGLTVPVSATYPNVTMLDYLLQAFKTATMNPNFKILPLAYANKAQNNSYNGLNKNRYALYSYDEESGRMDLPVDYTATMQNTINGFQWQNVAYGQFTGFKMYRPLEMLYFDW